MKDIFNCISSRVNEGKFTYKENLAVKTIHWDGELGVTVSLRRYTEDYVKTIELSVQDAESGETIMHTYINDEHNAKMTALFLIEGVVKCMR